MDMVPQELIELLKGLNLDNPFVILLIGWFLPGARTFWTKALKKTPGGVKNLAGKGLLAFCSWYLTQYGKPDERNN